MVLQWGVTAWQRIIWPLTASETHRFVAKPKVPAKYSDPNKSELVYEITSGMTSLDIVIPYANSPLHAVGKFAFFPHTHAVIKSAAANSARIRAARHWITGAFPIKQGAALLALTPAMPRLVVQYIRSSLSFH